MRSRLELMNTTDTTDDNNRAISHNKSQTIFYNGIKGYARIAGTSVAASSIYIPPRDRRPAGETDSTDAHGLRRMRHWKVLSAAVDDGVSQPPPKPAGTRTRACRNRQPLTGIGSSGRRRRQIHCDTATQGKVWPEVKLIVLSL